MSDQLQWEPWLLSFSALHSAAFSSEKPADRELDIIYDAMDSLMKLSRFDLLDFILHKTDPAISHIDRVLALLTTTLPASTKLSQRSPFFQTCHKYYTRDYPDSVNELLKGLE